VWGENHMARSVGSQELIWVRLIAQFSFQRACSLTSGRQVLPPVWPPAKMGL